MHQNNYKWIVAIALLYINKFYEVLVKGNEFKSMFMIIHGELTHIIAMFKYYYIYSLLTCICVKYFVSLFRPVNTTAYDFKKNFSDKFNYMQIRLL